MAGYEHTIRVICENCDKCFDKQMRIYTVINTDYKGSLSDKLVHDKLNRVTCPHCNTSFTYERPHLAYSLSKKYAICAVGTGSEQQKPMGRTYMFELFGINNMKFRLVNYLCEVSEKVRIFENGVDDIIIEQLKYNNFSAEYFKDKSDKILLFKEISNGNIVFEYKDFTDKVLEVHHIPFEQYSSCKSVPQPNVIKNGIIQWNKIDYNYIKETIND